MDENILQNHRYRYHFSRSIGVHWKCIGKCLLIPDRHLEVIDLENENCYDKAYQMLTKWIQIRADPSLNELKNALKILKQHDLIKILEDLQTRSSKEKKKSSLVKIVGLHAQSAPPGFEFGDVCLHAQSAPPGFEFGDDCLHAQSAPPTGTAEKTPSMWTTFLFGDPKPRYASIGANLSNIGDSIKQDFCLQVNEDKEERIFEQIKNLMICSTEKGNQEFPKIFMKHFYESKSTITDDIKAFIDAQGWEILINEEKTPHEVKHEEYFVDCFTNSQGKMWKVVVSKNIITKDEISLIIKCSKNIRDAVFYCPFEMGGWKPNEKIEWLTIDIHTNLIPNEDFKKFYPWISVCEGLTLILHDDTYYIEEIYRYIQDQSNLQDFLIDYCGKIFVTSNN